MAKEVSIRAGRHCVFNMHVHLVFVTKYRRKVFSAAALNTLHRVFDGVCAKFDAKLSSFEGERDHVHLLVEYPPKVSVSGLVNSLKGASSRVLRKEVPSVTRHYYKGGLWSPSYFASSCGGAPLDLLKQYIEQQNSPRLQERLISPP